MRHGLLALVALAACTCEDRNEFATEDGRRYEAIVRRSVGCDCDPDSPRATPIHGSDTTTIAPIDGRGGGPVILLGLPDGMAVCPEGTTSSWSGEQGRTVTSAPCSHITCTSSE